ncbi:hypothetical protein Q4E40_02830 [Pontibacter sp. BT731]|uniref:hypothetical protein n=1 Tax=Pontibacter coccineus TaxID=3063328 RepID=UPI0026E1FC3F|nr:hypothetical protein [Pontibacter sp. BT731]MDO6389048.1 hypothetical protein [Pontibacter sp. BT731]
MNQNLIAENERKLSLCNDDDSVQLQIEQEGQDAFIDLTLEEVRTLIWGLNNCLPANTCFDLTSKT